MNSRRNLIISGILFLIAGIGCLLALTTYNQNTSTIIMVSASVIFMTGVVVFMFKFKE